MAAGAALRKYLQPAVLGTGTPQAAQCSRSWTSVDDLDKCEWFVPIQWLETRPLTQAVHEMGFYGLQHTVCRPTTAKWRTTVERLKQVFTKFDQP